LSAQEAYLAPDRSEPLVETTVGALLREVAAGEPDRVFLVDGTGDRETRARLTYADVERRALRVAHFLASEFTPEENIAVWAPNSLEWVLLELGAALAGVTLVMINPAFRQDEVAYVLRQSRSVAVFLVDNYRDNPMGEIIAALRPELPRLRNVYRFEDWYGLMESDRSRPLPRVMPHQSVMIQYTSGTTGKPKGAVLSHHGVLNTSQLTVKRIRLSQHSIWLLATPLFHTGGSVYCLLGTLFNRGTLVIMPTFDPALLIRLVEEEKVNYFQSVPTLHLRVLEHPEFSTARVASLIGIGSGGTTVAEELVHRFESEYDAEYFMIFGQTELSSTTTHTCRGDTVAHKARTIGLALPQIEMKVVDPETGATVMRGAAVGEICVRGFSVMKQYFDMPEQTAKTIDADGWLHTGDLGCMDDDGYMRITGRLKDMIIRGGENIFPREIEDVLATHPAVGEAAVIGVPDREWGEQIAAVVRLRSGCTVDCSELEQFLRQRIARHKIPRRWHFVDEFPLTPSGKIKKFVLRDTYGA